MVQNNEIRTICLYYFHVKIFFYFFQVLLCSPFPCTLSWRFLLFNSMFVEFVVPVRVHIRVCNNIINFVRHIILIHCASSCNIGLRYGDMTTTFAIVINHADQQTSSHDRTREEIEGIIRLILQSTYISIKNSDNDILNITQYQSYFSRLCGIKFLIELSTLVIF